MASVDDYAENAADEKRDRHATFLAIVGIVSISATFLFLILSQLGTWAAAIGIGGLVLGAGAAGGGFLGFLFSVPRILSKDSEVEDAPAPGSQTLVQKIEPAFSRRTPISNGFRNG